MGDLDRILDDHGSQFETDPDHYEAAVVQPDRHRTGQPLDPDEAEARIRVLEAETAELRDVLADIANGNAADPAARAVEVLTRTDPLRDAT